MKTQHHKAQDTKIAPAKKASTAPYYEEEGCDTNDEQTILQNGNLLIQHLNLIETLVDTLADRLFFEGSDKAEGETKEPYSLDQKLRHAISQTNHIVGDLKNIVSRI